MERASALCGDRLSGSVFGLILLAGASAATGCGPPPLPQRGDPPVVSLEPATPLDAAAAVLRVHVSGLSGVDPNALVVFRGELDSYYSARIRAVAIPETLAARRVPSLAWAGEGTELVLAPAERLVPGETYGVAAFGRGTLEHIVVDVAQASYAARIWPPPGALAGGKRWVFCGEAAMPPPGDTILLSPANARAIVGAGASETGAQADRCLHLDVAPEDAGLAVAPPELGGVALDPSPLTLGAASTQADDAVCGPGESPLGPGCARVMDDRVVVRNGAAPLLWVFDDSTTQMVVSTAPAEAFTLRGLLPRSRVSFAGTVTDLAGDETPFDARFTTLAPLSHVVLNEVLANPSGPEKAGEWVELVNDGTTPIELEGWSLEDAGRKVPLPRGTLAAGAYALVVSSAYDAASNEDVLPVEGTLILRVPELGSGGLSNEGERLRLEDPDGVLTSEFPAIAASKSGVSIARRTPSSADGDESAFGPSAPPGASPGAPNVLDGR
jgi:hypothetical protein